MPANSSPDMRFMMTLPTSAPEELVILAVHLKPLSDALTLPLEPICTIPVSLLISAKPWGEPNPHVTHCLMVRMVSLVTLVIFVALDGFSSIPSAMGCCCSVSFCSVFSWKTAVILTTSPVFAGLGSAFSSLRLISCLGWLASWPLLLYRCILLPACPCSGWRTALLDHPHL